MCCIQNNKANLVAGRNGGGQIRIFNVTESQCSLHSKTKLKIRVIHINTYYTDFQLYN